MPGMDAQILVDRAREIAHKHGLEFQAHGNGSPLYVDPHSDFVQEFLDLTGKTEAKTVTYGTDGAMFGDLKHKVVYGPGDIAQAPHRRRMDHARTTRTGNGDVRKTHPPLVLLRGIGCEGTGLVRRLYVENEGPPRRYC